MIVSGKLCRNCRQGKCQDDTGIEIECPNCNGFGCEHCVNGRIAIDGCPNNYCRPAAKYLPMFDLFAKGLPPVSGGVLDQSADFIEAARFYTSDLERLKNDG